MRNPRRFLPRHPSHLQTIAALELNVTDEKSLREITPAVADDRDDPRTIKVDFDVKRV